MRVLVTRPLHQQRYFVAGCRKLGLDPVSLPTIDILPTDIDIDLKSIEAADLVLFTSKNAVEFAHLNAPLPWNNKHVQCIGPATYQAVLNHQQTVNTEPVKPYTSESFLQSLATQKHSSDIRRAVIIKGEGGRKLIEEYFDDNDIELSTYSVYRRLCPTISNEERNSVFRTPPEIISITSDDGMKNLMEMSGSEHKEALLHSQLIVNSDRSARFAAQYGFVQPALIANPPGDKGQLGVLETYLKTHPKKN